MLVKCWLYWFSLLVCNLPGTCMEPPCNLHQSEYMIELTSVDTGNAFKMYMEPAWNPWNLHGTSSKTELHQLEDTIQPPRSDVRVGRHPSTSSASASASSSASSSSSLSARLHVWSYKVQLLGGSGYVITGQSGGPSKLHDVCKSVASRPSSKARGSYSLQIPMQKGTATISCACQ